MKEKIRHTLVIILACMIGISAVEPTVPVIVQAASKATTANKSITLTTSKIIKTKDTIKSVKSSNRSILSAKKISSKQFKVTSQYKYGSAVITVKFKNGKTEKYKYSIGKYSLEKGKNIAVTTKYAIKSLTSSKTKAALVKKTSSKKFKVTAKKAGTAKITVKFKNGKTAVYYFKVTGSSGGSGNNNTDGGTSDNDEKVSLDKSSLNITEGDTATLKVSIPSAYSNNSIVFWSSDNTSVATVYGNLTDPQKMKTVTVNAVGEGKATITAICILHTEQVQVSCQITVNESKKSASIFGFEAKTKACNSRDEDGTNKYKIDFFCDGSEYWINQNVTFEVEDVTPTAYANMFSDMGVKYQAPALEIDSAASYLREWNEKKGQSNWIPITFPGPGNVDVEAKSGKRLTVSAGMSTRAVKIVAKQGTKVLDYVYVTSTGKNINNANADQETYSRQDEELYRAVLNKVEKALWTPDMTNLEKLRTLANYINETTHYPNSDTVSKEYNPTYWKNWSVDDSFLLLSGAIIHRIMILQGGRCDCTTAGLLKEIARDDLEITVFNKEPENGEGVWLVYGAESSTPINPTHVSMKYKDPEGNLYIFDASGMNCSHSDPYTMHEVTCEAHGCQEKLISLK